MPGFDLTSQATVWVLATVLKGTVLLVSAVCLAVALRRMSAAVRHLVWSGGFIALLLLPLLSIVVPWRLPVVRVPVPDAVVIPPVPIDVGQIDVPNRAPMEPREELGVPTASAPAAAKSLATSSQPSLKISLAGAATAVWLIVVVLLVGRLAIGGAVLRNLVRRSRPLEMADWKRPLVEAADRLGLPRLPRLVVSDRLPIPFACGLLRPTIVLPAAALEWDDHRRRAVLCHELAHVRRADLLMNTLGHLATALWWFHPLAWVALRRLRVEGERASDDVVLGVGTRASEYADHLLHIVCDAASARAPAVALPMAQRHEFEGRLLALLERRAQRDPPSRRRTALAAALAIVLVVPLAAASSVTVVERDGADPTATARDNHAAAERAGIDAESNGRTDVDRTADTSARGADSATEAPSGATSAEPAGDVLAARRPEIEDAAQDTSREAAVTAALVYALQDSIPVVRLSAARALGQREVPEAAAPLGDLLVHDREPEIRAAAAWSLGQIESPAATASLSAALTGDSSVAVRETAAWALGEIEDPGSVTALASAVAADESGQVRETAAWALGEVEPRAAPAALIGALQDPVAGVRETAAWALGEIADAAAADALVAALDDPEVSVRRTAIWALAQMPGDAAQPALLRALQDDDPEVRGAAARALGGHSIDPRPRPRPRPYSNY